MVSSTSNDVSTSAEDLFILLHPLAIAKWMKAMPFVTMMYSNQNIGVQFVTKPQGLPGKINQEKRLLLFHSYLAWKSLTLAFKSRPCKPD